MEKNISQKLTRRVSMYIKTKLLLFCCFIGFFTQGEIMALSLKSVAFNDGKSIPSQYTCDGNDISPPLAWDGIPQNTKSFVLIVDDPDAPNGNWTHWVLYNIHPSTTELTEDIKNLPTGTQSGANSWDVNFYKGPCPPDREHRYYFKLYALDSLLQLPDKANKNQVETALKGHVLEQAQLMGRYNRKIK